MLRFLSVQSLPSGPTSFTVSLDKLNVSHQIHLPDTTQKRDLTSLLEVQLEHSRSETEEGGPVFVPKPGVEALHAQASLVARLSGETGSDHVDSSMMQQFHHILGLCVALWGRTPGCNPDTDNTGSYAYMKARKDAFSEWLVETTKQTIDSEVKDVQQMEDGYLKVILSHMTGHQVSKAWGVARRMRDHRLGMLIAQGGYSPVTRGMLQKQLDHWKAFGHDQYIDHDRLRIYALLAGFLIWPMSEEMLNCCADLDWKRALALHLWYHCSPTASISDAVAAYEASFGEMGPLNPYTRPPYPPYYENCDEPSSTESEVDAPFDTCYLLLKLYCDRSQRLDRLLAPVTSVPSHLDFRISWFLQKVLQSLGYVHLSRWASDSLNVGFASQLESWGLWHWAVFALLHIEDPACREVAVKELLTRNVSGMREGDVNPETGLSEQEGFLHDRLNVPHNWIYAAKAVRAGWEGNYKDKAIFEIKGEMWNDAHETVTNHLATEAVIDEELCELRSLLEPLAEHSGEIQNWSFGGQVLLEYLNVCDAIELAVKGELGAYGIEKIKPGILSLCDCITCLSNKTPRDRLCQAEIAKKTSTLLHYVTTLEQKSPDAAVQLASRSFDKLAMPGDDCLEELQALARTYASF